MGYTKHSSFHKFFKSFLYGQGNLLMQKRPELSFRSLLRCGDIMILAPGDEYKEQQINLSHLTLKS